MGTVEMPGVWLLEINAGPDLGIFGQRLHGRCVELLRGTLRVSVEPYVCDPAPRAFSSALADRCDQIAGKNGFSTCIWTSSPKTASATGELSAFMQKMSIAGKWARSLHEGSGIEVQGP